MQIAIIDQYSQIVSDAVVKTVGPIPAVAAFSYVGLPVAAGRLLGGKKGQRVGLLIALGLIAYTFVRTPDLPTPPPTE